jgi:hypothetical protein
MANAAVHASSWRGRGRRLSQRSNVLMVKATATSEAATATEVSTGCLIHPPG